MRRHWAFVGSGLNFSITVFALFAWVVRLGPKLKRQLFRSADTVLRHEFLLLRRARLTS